MKTRIIHGLTILAAGVPVANATEDYIQCHREKSQFRQFCYLNEAPINSVITIPAVVTINDTSLNLNDVIQSQKVYANLLSEGGMKDVNLPSLAPVVKATIEYTYGVDCQRSDLWNDRLWLSVIDPISGEELPLERIKFGLDDYETSLSRLQSINFQPWATTVNGSQMEISSSIKLKNLDHRSDRPLAYQRIPRHCRMDVHNIGLSYDAGSFVYDLNRMYLQADNAIAYLAKSTVLHANLIDNRAGAKCSIYSFGQEMKTISLLDGFIDESDWTWEELSFATQDAITDKVADAIAIGAINESEINSDYWDYFKTTLQTEATNLCGDVPESAYIVSIEPFMQDGDIINQQGYYNAIQYELAKQNLIQAAKGAYAVSFIAKEIVADFQEADWINSPSLTSYF